MTKKTQKEISNKVPLYDGNGKKEGAFELDKSIFTGRYNPACIYQAVLMYRSNKRTGTASTKVRSEVSGGGKKPWRQKGTGRARTSSIRNPIWRGGGAIFGPHPRNFKYQLPQKIKKISLVHSLNSKLSNGLFGVIKELKIEEPKTKIFKNIMDKAKLGGSILLTVDKNDKKLYLASRNIKSITLTLYSNLNTFDVLRHDNFLITEKAVEGLTKRLKPATSI